jgi:hypothetical protein
MNVITKELTFFYEGQVLSAEVEYTVDLNPNHDGAKVVGEITNNEGDVFEVKDRIICAEFHARFWDLVEDIRRELVIERGSKLRDFKGVHRIGKTVENELM